VNKRSDEKRKVYSADNFFFFFFLKKVRPVAITGR